MPRILSENRKRPGTAIADRETYRMLEEDASIELSGEVLLLLHRRHQLKIRDRSHVLPYLPLQLKLTGLIPT